MGGPTWQIEDREILDRRYQTADRVQRAKERVRLGVLKVISSAYEIPMSPWGILTGVRPTKLVHNLLDRGLTPDKVKDLLTDVYAVSLERAGLIQEIAAWQRQFFSCEPQSARWDLHRHPVLPDTLHLLFLRSLSSCDPRAPHG